MKTILLCTLADIMLLCNTFLGVKTLNKNEKIKSLIKILLCLLIFLIYSILFHSVYINSETSILKLCALILFYVRFPLIVAIVTKVSFLKSLFVFFFISQSCDLIQALICNLFNNSTNFLDRTLQCLISIFIRFILFVFLFILFKKGMSNKVKVVLKLISHKIFFLIAVDLLLIGSIVSVVGYKTENLTAQAVSTNVVLLLVFVISIIIVFSLISNCISKTYYNGVNSILEKQIENQIEYYKQTEMLNDDLRRFKHDYTNHILCLKAMINSNQNNEALEYIEKINSEISLSTQTFNTGHKIADAILNEKHRIHSDVNIKFEGCIPQFIDNVDLCIVLGNAVDNAIEACEKLNETDKIIDMTANYQQSYFILIMKNPVTKDYTIYGSFPETTKEDPLKHGFGLSNIKRIVDKYDGDMSVEADNGIFTLYLALKVN